MTERELTDEEGISRLIERLNRNLANGRTGLLCADEYEKQGVTLIQDIQRDGLWSVFLKMFDARTRTCDALDRDIRDCDLELSSGNMLEAEAAWLPAISRG